MNNETRQSVLDLLAAAKTHIESGEHSEAVEKIDAAIAVVENEGVDTTSAEPEGEGEVEGEVEGGESEGDNEGGEEGKPKDPPLPGQGTNGRP